MEYAIGASKWPGISKVAEEAGELVQVVGKIIGADGVDVHWDGSNLRARLSEEIADVTAAICFVVQHNNLDVEAIEKRVQAKFALFEKWHQG